MDLNELIDRTHFDYEQNETKAKQLEDRILKVPGMSKSYLPKRKYTDPRPFVARLVPSALWTKFLSNNAIWITEGFTTK